MTAINILRTESVVHLATSGLTYGLDRPYLAGELYVLPHMPLILAGRGVSVATRDYGTMLRFAFETFGELVAGIEAAFPLMHARFLRSFESPSYQARNSQLAIAGWSQARQQCEAYVIRGGEEDKNAFPPWKLIPINGLAFSPAPKEDIQVDPAHIERDMVALMEAQRRDCTGVGGFCQLASLTERTITQRILKRWPVTADDQLTPAQINACQRVS